jgi:hypothetical protein
MTATPSLNEFERFHAHRTLKPPPSATVAELLITLLIACITTPFFFVTFFVLPMMGQITVSLVAVLTVAYLYYRRSLLVLLAVTLGCGAVSLATFSTIQAIKYHLEIPLFIFLVLGVPVCIGYSILVVSQIWRLRGGVE